MALDQTSRGGRQRRGGTSALVLSRHETPLGFGAPEQGDRETVPPPGQRPRTNQWATVVTWVILGAAIASVWTLLLFGDSLSS
jgi:hypothetical protein